MRKVTSSVATPETLHNGAFFFGSVKDRKMFEAKFMVYPNNCNAIVDRTQSKMICFHAFTQEFLDAAIAFCRDHKIKRLEWVSSPLNIEHIRDLAGKW